MEEDKNASGKPSPLPLDEIRIRLQALGYLQSPLERFLSGPSGRRNTWLGALVLSLRVALLFGVLLAALTAAGSLLSDPAFVEHPLDVLVFSLYLFAACSTASFLLVLAPALYWVKSGRKGPGLRAGGRVRSGVLSVAVALGLAAYLLGWWHVMVLESGLIEPVGWFSLAALVVILLVSLGASRLIVLVYFLLAGVPEPLRGPRRMLTKSFIFTLAALLLLELAWYSGVYLNNSADRSLADSVKDRPAMNRLPMLLLGIDGLDYDRLLEMTRLDSLPNLKLILAHGFSAPIESDVNYLAPQVWNTVSTGLTPEQHGVNFFTLTTLRGLTRQPHLPVPTPEFRSALEHFFPFFSLVRQVPLSSSARRSKSIWEIVELFGIRSGVVNWWASWPGTPSAGFTVSERTFPKLTLIHQNEPANMLAYFEQEVYPKAEFDSLALLAGQMNEGFGGVLEVCPQLSSFLESGVGVNAAELVSSVYQADYFYTQAAISLLSRHKVSFLALYLQGADILSRLDERTDLVRSERLDGLLPEYYVFLDRMLGELERAYQPAGLIVVVCDPGKRGRRLGDKGAVVFSGIETRSGIKSDSPFYLEDITPTMLYLMGLPVARNMAGRPRVEVGITGPGSPPPLSYVRSYGAPPSSRGPASAYRHDREMIERLRSLGYVR